MSQIKTLLTAFKKNPICYLFLLSLLIPATISAQEKYINYHSDQEKQYLLHAKDYKSLFKLSLLAHVDEPTADQYIATVDTYIGQIGWTENDNKKPSKKLKVLFKNIHNTFLQIYDPEIPIDEMFKSGKYQCVSASILYAYIFEALQIPHEIKEEPTHVYVVAFPNEHNILIETTDPSTGVFAPNAKAKAEYVNSLIKNKYVEEKYVNQVGTEKAFNEFFYGKSNITFKELLGLAYYNTFVKVLLEESYEKSYSEIYKANVLYPAKKHEFLKQVVMEDLIQKLSYNNLEDWEILTATINNSENDLLKKTLPFQFSTIANNYLIKSNKKENIDSIYNYLATSLQDSTLLKDVTNTYFRQLAYSYYSSSKYIDADSCLEILFLLNKEDLSTKNQIKDNTMKMLSRTPGKHSVEKLDKLIVKYPFFSIDDDIQTFYIYNLAYEIHSLYRKDERKTGIKYFEKLLEKLQASDDLSSINEEMLEDIFTLTAGYYVMNNNKTKAREVIKTASNLFPTNKKFKDTYLQIN